jgi:hypothetical protein
MILNRPYTQTQFGSNFLAAHLLANKLYDLFFPLCQLLRLLVPVRIKLTLGDHHRQLIRCSEAIITISIIHRLCCPYQFFARRILQQITFCTRFQHIHDQVVLVKHRQSDHIYIRKFTPDLATGFDTIHHRHLDIRNDHVRLRADDSGH